MNEDNDLFDFHLFQNLVNDNLQTEKYLSAAEYAVNYNFLRIAADARNSNQSLTEADIPEKWKITGDARVDSRRRTTKNKLLSKHRLENEEAADSS